VMNEPSAIVPRWWHIVLRQNSLLQLSFPYVCPEPVLVKCAVLCTNG
jgi:hypothetical protein